MYGEEELPGFPKSLSSPQKTPACFCISPSIPRLGFIFSWIKEDLLSALCRKLSPWTAPWRGKLGIRKWNKRKSGKPILCEKKTKHFHPPRSGYNLTVCCDHHTPNNAFLHFRHLIKMRCPWKELRDLLLPAVPLGGNVGIEKPGWDPQAVSPGSAQPRAIGNTVPPRFAVKHLSSSGCHFVSPGLLSPAVHYPSHSLRVTWLSFLT